MNYSELIKLVAEKSKCPQETVKKIIEATVSVTKDAVATGDDVTFHKLGKFSRRLRKARTGKNPATGAVITIPEAVVPVFKPAKEFKELLK